MILDDIAAKTKLHVEKAKREKPLAELRREAEAARMTETRGKTFAAALAAPGLSFICEVKRASPSKGLLAADFPYLHIAREYERAGAAAVSVLTEPDFFLGSNVHLKEIAAQISLPVLRKDFVIDPYQIYEAKVLGAKAALLITALLDAAALKEFVVLCGSLDMDALVEVHDEAEAQMALKAGAKIIGINNRDLKTFKVDTGTTARLRRLIPPGVLVVSESGIRERRDIELLENIGVDAALIGETLMCAKDKRMVLAALRGEA